MPWRREPLPPIPRFIRPLDLTPQTVLQRTPQPTLATDVAPARSAVAARAEGFGLAVPTLLRGKPNGRTTVEKGYRSHNIHEAELCLDCGFTIDGELHAPQKGRTLIITATDRLKFVRA